MWSGACRATATRAGADPSEIVAHGRVAAPGAVCRVGGDTRCRRGAAPQHARLPGLAIIRGPHRPRGAVRLEVREVKRRIESVGPDLTGIARIHAKRGMRLFLHGRETCELGHDARTRIGTPPRVRALAISIAGRRPLVSRLTLAPGSGPRGGGNPADVHAARRAGRPIVRGRCYIRIATRPGEAD